MYSINSGININLELKMNFLKILFCQLILCYIFSNCESIEFCQSFTQNNYNIDYGFGGGLDNQFKGYIVIDNNYWKIQKTSENKIEFISNMSSISEGLGKDYKMAFKTNTDYIGLIDNNNIINWRQFSNGILTKNDEIFSTELSYNITDFDPSIAFTVDYSYSQPIIGLLEQRFNENENKFQRVYEYFENTTETDDLGNNEDNTYLNNFEQFFNGLDQTLQIMAIYGPYLKYQTTNPTDYYFIILFNMNNTIKYCLITKEKEELEGCKTETLKNLINCELKLESKVENLNNVSNVITKESIDETLKQINKTEQNSTIGSQNKTIESQENKDYPLNMTTESSVSLTIRLGMSAVLLSIVLFSINIIN